MELPQEVQEAAARLERVVFNEEDPVAVYGKYFRPDKREDNPWGRRQISGRLLEEDLEELGRHFLGLIQSGAIPSQEVIDAIQRIVRSASMNRRRVYGSAISEVFDWFSTDLDTIQEWLAKVEQKEEE